MASTVVVPLAVARKCEGLIATRDIPSVKQGVELLLRENIFIEGCPAATGPGTPNSDQTALLKRGLAMLANSPFETLGVGVDARTQEIRKAYKKMALKYHPDKSPQTTPLFQLMNAMVDKLADPGARAKEAGRATRDTKKDSGVSRSYYSGAASAARETNFPDIQQTRRRSFEGAGGVYGNPSNSYAAGAAKKDTYEDYKKFTADYGANANEEKRKQYYETFMQEQFKKAESDRRAKEFANQRVFEKKLQEQQAEAAGKVYQQFQQASTAFNAAGTAGDTAGAKQQGVSKGSQDVAYAYYINLNKAKAGRPSPPQNASNVEHTTGSTFKVDAHGNAQKQTEASSSNGFQGKVPVPHQFRCFSVASTSVELEWKTAAHRNKLLVELNWRNLSEGKMAWESANKLIGSGVCRKKNLTSGCKYEFRLRAVEELSGAMLGFRSEWTPPIVVNLPLEATKAAVSTEQLPMNTANKADSDLNQCEPKPVERKQTFTRFQQRFTFEEKPGSVSKDDKKEYTCTSRDDSPLRPTAGEERHTESSRRRESFRNLLSKHPDRDPRLSASARLAWGRETEQAGKQEFSQPLHDKNDNSEKSNYGDEEIIEEHLHANVDQRVDSDTHHAEEVEEDIPGVPFTGRTASAEKNDEIAEELRETAYAEEDFEIEESDGDSLEHSSHTVKNAPTTGKSMNGDVSQPSKVRHTKDVVTSKSVEKINENTTKSHVTKLPQVPSPEKSPMKPTVKPKVSRAVVGQTNGKVSATNVPNDLNHASIGAAQVPANESTTKKEHSYPGHQRKESTDVEESTEEFDPFHCDSFDSVDEDHEKESWFELIPPSQVHLEKFGKTGSTDSFDGSKRYKHVVREEPFKKSKKVGYLLQGVSVLGSAECGDWLKVKIHARTYRRASKASVKSLLGKNIWGWCQISVDGHQYIQKANALASSRTNLTSSASVTEEAPPSKNSPVPKINTDAPPVKTMRGIPPSPLAKRTPKKSNTNSLPPLRSYKDGDLKTVLTPKAKAKSPKKSNKLKLQTQQIAAPTGLKDERESNGAVLSEVSTWRELYDNFGNAYYYNPVTAESKWEPPEWVQETDPRTGAK